MAVRLMGQLEGQCHRVALLMALLSAPLAAESIEIKEQVDDSTTPNEPSEEKAIIIRATRLPSQSIDSSTYRVEDTPEAAVISGLELMNRIPFVNATEQGITLLGRSGLKILVDGNETPDPINFLRSLRAKQIEAIEIVSNPSARYAASAQAGVINIRLRRFADAKLAGSLNGSIDTRGSREINVAPTFARGDVSFLLSGLVSSQPVRGETIVNAPTEGLTPGSNGSAERYSTRGHTNFLTASGTATATLAEKRELSLVGNLGRFTTRRKSAIETGNDDADARFADRSTDHSNFYKLVMSYQAGSKAAKHLKLTATAAGSRADTRLRSFEGDRLAFRVDTRSRKQEFSAVVDGTLNFAKSRRARFGSSFGLHRDASLLTFEDQMPDSLGIESADVELDWNELASYADYQFSLKKVQVLLGLRAERRELKFDGSSGASIAYFGLFPSLHLERQFGKGVTLRASYSRRISWPSFNDLNPVPRFANAITVSQGNPDLKPPISHSMEWSLQRVTKSGEIGLTLYHKRTRDTVSVLSESVDGVLINRAVNAGSARSWGASVSARGSLPKQLTYQLSADVFHDRERFDFLVNGDRAYRAVRWGTSFQLERRTGPLGKAGSNIFHLSGRYQSKRTLGFTTFSPQFGSRVSWTHQLSKRMSTVLTGTNLLASKGVKSAFRSQDQLFERYDKDFENAVNLALVIDLGAQ